MDIPRWEPEGVPSFKSAAAAAKSLQSCPILCDPIDGSPPGSPVPGILQAGTLELVAISFSSAWKWKLKVELLSRVRLFATPWTAAYQAPPSMGFSRQEYWSGLPLPSPSIMLSRDQLYPFKDVPYLFLASSPRPSSSLYHLCYFFPSLPLRLPPNPEIHFLLLQFLSPTHETTFLI